MKKLSILPALLIVMLLVTGSCQNEPDAAPIEEGAGDEKTSDELRYQGPVTDIEDILTTTQEEILKEKMEIIERGRDLELAIITVKKIPAEMDALQYASVLGNDWEIGTEEGNGLVILVSATEGKTGIAVGRKLEETYNSEVTGQIVSKQMLPFFRTGYYQQGLINTLDAIAEIDPAGD